MSLQIKAVLEDIDKNIKLIEDAKKIKLTDVQTLITIIFKVLKDMLESFDGVFKMVKKIIDIEKSVEDNSEENQALENYYV